MLDYCSSPRLVTGPPPSPVGFVQFCHGLMVSREGPEGESCRSLPDNSSPPCYDAEVELSVCPTRRGISEISVVLSSLLETTTNSTVISNQNLISGRYSPSPVVALELLPIASTMEMFTSSHCLPEMPGEETVAMGGKPFASEVDPP